MVESCRVGDHMWCKGNAAVLKNETAGSQDRKKGKSMRKYVVDFAERPKAKWNSVP